MNDKDIEISQGQSVAVDVTIPIKIRNTGEKSVQLADASAEAVGIVARAVQNCGQLNEIWNSLTFIPGTATVIDYPDVSYTTIIELIHIGQYQAAVDILDQCPPCVTALVLAEGYISRKLKPIDGRKVAANMLVDKQVDRNKKRFEL